MNKPEEIAAELREVALWLRAISISHQPRYQLSNQAMRHKALRTLYAAAAILEQEKNTNATQRG